MAIHSRDAAHSSYGLSIRLLAQRLELDRTAVAAAAERLERARLIYRDARSGRGGRDVTFHITQAGAQAIGRRVW